MKMIKHRATIMLLVPSCFVLPLTGCNAKKKVMHDAMHVVLIS